MVLFDRKGREEAKAFDKINSKTFQHSAAKPQPKTHHGDTEARRSGATTKALRSGDPVIGRSGDLKNRVTGSSGHRNQNSANY